MNSEQKIAADAQALLENPVFQGALDKMEERLDANILNVSADDEKICARVVLAKQILKGIVREIHRYIENGNVADIIEIEEIRKLSIKERVVGKMVR